MKPRGHFQFSCRKFERGDCERNTICHYCEFVKHIFTLDYVTADTTRECYRYKIGSFKSVEAVAVEEDEEQLYVLTVTLHITLHQKKQNQVEPNTVEHALKSSSLVLISTLSITEENSCTPLDSAQQISSVMPAVNRFRSLYWRLNSDMKDSLALNPLSVQESVNASTDLYREVDPVVSAIRRGDVEALNGLATSAPRSLMKENNNGWIPLHDAAFCGQTECLRTLLRVHPDSVDKRTLQEQTALLLAVSCEHLSCARCLLEAGADPDISSKNKETPLYKACELENVDMVSLIISYGASVNQRCGQAWTALLEAVSRNNTHICEILLRAGATVNPANTYSITPLIVAAQWGHLKALSYLIEKGADVNMQTCDGLTALHEASKNGHRDVVAMLLAKNADANKPTNSGLLPLHTAAQYGYHEIVSLLVSVTSRARLRHSWISPLHLAAQHNRHAVAAALLQTGADVNATLAHSHSVQFADRRATALYFAVAHGSTETAEVLLNAGASLSLDPVSPLLVAVKRSCVSTASLLLERGADTDARIPCYATMFPAVIALCMNNLPLLKCLLDNGCDALSCFTCTYGSIPHPAPTVSHLSTTGSNGYIFQNDNVLSVNCNEPPESATQFCEWVSSSVVCNWAGPIVDLLLEHVGQVQMCSKLKELLDSREEWHAIKRKSLSPRPLLHLCRVKIRTQMGRQRLRSVSSLPLPDRMIRYLSLTD